MVWRGEVLFHTKLPSGLTRASHTVVLPPALAAQPHTTRSPPARRTRPVATTPTYSSLGLGSSTTRPAGSPLDEMRRNPDLVDCASDCKTPAIMKPPPGIGFTALISRNSGYSLTVKAWLGIG